MTAKHQERPGRTRLGRRLTETGALSSDWVPAFAAVDRAAFLPDLMWLWDMDTETAVPVDRREDAAAWHDTADSDKPIVTQWDDGRHNGTKPGRVPTSSASAPSIVYGMLRDLDIDVGMRTLDIGTGTGETAGLLAHRLGWRNVSTLELDPAVSWAARERLCRLGLYVTTVIGDGADGYPAAAPYDRLLVTYAVRTVPAAWIAQTRSGGVLVAPWGTHYSNRDAVARLVVNGRVASGRFTQAVEFMKDRHDRAPWPNHGEYVTDWSGASKQTADLAPAELDAARFALGLAVPDCVHTAYAEADGTPAAWWYSIRDHSWAAARWSETESASVYQRGPRRLWDEIQAAHRWWELRGCPLVERYGLTVDPSGATVWLDEPDQPVPQTATR
ncbi:protein-L-isoaspartate(D-aspartate) O-methyltransferase [Streptomyces diastatochromogenes]|uniref:Protein-L-isoaspartate O-methyltransferase n=1 Tax=Streptomyces diastatochromogenes TaxID=42236 RepID=A0A233SF08_STRDA|nr:protein-L-isoaspartate(D-aspartate) O-methyltransferase [Streptomyces diastatochromogenes]MCZ0989524.1 protein-L-isoaspartate(D-aspartate) O-methyltransferase [Streptomyces diastatochromogenes]OXY94236.1 protein-L-isoaspartate(D-aspartate) O-methyltransferase [Streptomyces diastatochromogenes]